ncbi:hypothetical protein [Phyllobacterium sp. YR531]|uniref:hypothetical protein n=1 Tax=Phyllobacterium sp. YR531 TaxID=1144343 RepID=UPI00026F4A07|nr:hypothetical protein [Phyllobacterium sp. YR531]EJM98666.1 hypothetical protein PMI41_04426 [Phyllobacterium sp. YR531]
MKNPLDAIFSQNAQRNIQDQAYHMRPDVQARDKAALDAYAKQSLDGDLQSFAQRHLGPLLTPWIISGMDDFSISAGTFGAHIGIELGTLDVPLKNGPKGKIIKLKGTLGGGMTVSADMGLPFEIDLPKKLGTALKPAIKKIEPVVRKVDEIAQKLGPKFKFKPVPLKDNIQSQIEGALDDVAEKLHDTPDEIITFKGPFWKESKGVENFTGLTVICKYELGLLMGGMITKNHEGFKRLEAWEKMFGRKAALTIILFNCSRFAGGLGPKACALTCNAFAICVSEGLAATLASIGVTNLVYNLSIRSA